jgi:hypothetical protein
MKFLDDVIEVLLRTLGHARDVVGPLRVPVRIHVDEVALQVGHLEAATDAPPQVRVGARELIDRALIDVNRFFRGGSLSNEVGVGLGVG